MWPDCLLDLGTDFLVGNIQRVLNISNQLIWTTHVNWHLEAMGLEGPDALLGSVLRQPDLDCVGQEVSMRHCHQSGSWDSLLVRAPDS